MKLVTKDTFNGVLFRFFVFIILIIIGIIFYFVFPSDLSIFLIITNSVLAMMGSIKWEHQWFLILSVLAIIYCLLFITLPSSPCGSSHIKLGAETSCDCKGIVKNSPFFTSDSGMSYSQCVGVRTKCYRHSNIFSSPRRTTEEIPCK